MKDGAGVSFVRGGCWNTADAERAEGVQLAPRARELRAGRRRTAPRTISRQVAQTTRGFRVFCQFRAPAFQRFFRFALRGCGLEGPLEVEAAAVYAGQLPALEAEGLQMLDDEGTLGLPPPKPTS